MYRSLNATAFFFVECKDLKPQNSFSPGNNLMERLESYLCKEMPCVASKIGEIYGDILRDIQFDIPYHFIYYNPESESLRTSFPSPFSSSHHSSNNCVLPQNIYR